MQLSMQQSMLKGGIRLSLYKSQIVDEDEYRQQWLAVGEGTGWALGSIFQPGSVTFAVLSIEHMAQLIQQMQQASACFDDTVLPQASQS